MKFKQFVFASTTALILFSAGAALVEAQDSTSVVEAATTKKKVMHNAYYYKKDGKSIVKNKNGKKKLVKSYQFIKVSKKITINGSKFYKVSGKNYYIKAENIDGTKRTLAHNAYIYTSKGKRKAGSTTLKKGRTITTYGVSFTIKKNGVKKSMYRIAPGEYVIITNFKKQTPSKVNSNIGSNTNTSAKTNTNTGSNTNTSAKTNTNTGSNTNTSAKTNTNTGSNTNTSAKTNTNTGSNTNTSAKTNTNTGSNTNTSAKTNTNTGSNINTSAKTDTNTSSNTNTSAKTDTNTSSNTNTSAKTNTNTGSNTNTSAKTNADDKSDTSPNATDKTSDDLAKKYQSWIDNIDDGTLIATRNTKQYQVLLSNIQPSTDDNPYDISKGDAIDNDQVIPLTNDGENFLKLVKGKDGKYYFASYDNSDGYAFIYPASDLKFVPYKRTSEYKNLVKKYEYGDDYNSARVTLSAPIDNVKAAVSLPDKDYKAGDTIEIMDPDVVLFHEDDGYAVYAATDDGQDPDGTAVGIYIPISSIASYTPFDDESYK